VSAVAGARRTLALARASARDLFAGQAVAAAILALVAFAVAGGEPRALDDAERHALLLRQRLELLATMATAAAVLGAAHAVEAGRRTQAFARLSTTPVSALESLSARLLGTFGGVAAIAIPVLLALLLLPQSGLIHQRDRFAPRSCLAPASIELATPDGARSRLREGSHAPALLEAGATLTLRFDVADASGWQLELSLAPASSEAAGRPLDWSIATPQRELMRAKGITGRVVVGPWSEPAPGPLVLTMRGVEGDEVLRVDAAEARLCSPRGSIVPSVVRALVGLLALVLLGSALGAGLAIVLPAALASALAGCLLVLAALKSLFADVVASLHFLHPEADPHAQVGPATRAFAIALEKLLTILPDAARACAAEPIAAAERAWQAADAHALLVALVYAGIATLLGAAWLHRNRGAA
jgi:hypothetical protein